MTLYIDTSDRLSTRVLRHIAQAGPQTVEQIVAALGIAPEQKPVIESTVRNFRNRGRLVGVRQQGVSGRPTVYSIKPEAAQALENPPERRPRRLKANPRTCPRRHRPFLPPRRPLSPDQRRWIGYFLAAGWRPGTTAKLFGLTRRDIEPLFMKVPNP